MKLAAAVAAGFVLHDVVDAVANWGLGVPGALEEDPMALFGAGWLETRNPGRPEFIKPELGGHKDYLHYMVTHDPLLIKINARAFSDLVNGKGSRPSLSESFMKHMEYAYHELKHTTAPLSEVAHVAFFTFASIHSNYFTYGDVRRTFGVTGVDESIWDSETFTIKDYEQNIPPVHIKGSLSGIDKIMHFANFAFLTHQYQYACKHGLQEATRIPRFARAVAAMGSTPTREAELLATLGQYVWEYFETAEWKKEMREKRQYIKPTKGFKDPDLSGDYYANKLAIVFAVALSVEPLDNEYMETVIRMLDTPEELIGELESQVGIPVSWPTRSFVQAPIDSM